MIGLARSALGGLVLAAVLATSAASAPAPDATIKFSGGSVAFIAGASWGSGTMTYKGHDYDLKVQGLSAGAIGANRYDIVGTVHNLKRAEDIEGTYSGVGASATGGGGGGEVHLRNAQGVEIKAASTSAGLHLSLGASGVTIKLK